MSKFDEELPFDELDPCCQKEIESKKKKALVDSKLRTVDRSNERLDLTRNVLQALSVRPKGINCHCCANPSDYPLLEYIKAEAAAGNKSSSSFANSFGNDANDDEEDSDFDDFDLDQFESPYELERKQELMELMAKQQRAQFVGLAKHTEDSVAHIQQLLPMIDNLVLHVYDPSSMLSARIDYCLEGLATKYIGSMFRRTFYQPKMMQALNLVDMAIPSRGSSLIFFRDGRAISHEIDMYRFGDESAINHNAIERYLDSVGVLRRDLDEHRFGGLLTLQNDIDSSIVGGSRLKFTAMGLTSDDDVDIEEEESYCGDPKCGRTFPHEHIAGGSSGSPGRIKSTGNGPSFLLPMNQAEPTIRSSDGIANP